jgi:hypothetical protein
VIEHLLISPLPYDAELHSNLSENLKPAEAIAETMNLIVLRR